MRQIEFGASAPECRAADVDDQSACFLCQSALYLSEEVRGKVSGEAIWRIYAHDDGGSGR